MVFSCVPALPVVREKRCKPGTSDLGRNVEPSDAEGVLLTEAAAQASGGSRRESRLACGRGLVNVQQPYSVSDMFGK